MKDLKLKIKKFKAAGGEETLRFQLELYINNKRSAIISNGGTGGPHDWYWLDSESEKLFNQHLRELIDQNYFEFDFEQGDELIDELINELQIEKDCKKHLCIQIKGERGYHIFEKPDSPEERQWALALFAHREFEYLNDRYPTKKAKPKAEAPSSATPKTKEQLLKELRKYILAQKLKYNPDLDTMAASLGFHRLTTEEIALLDYLYPMPAFAFKLWFNLETEAIFALHHFIKASGIQPLLEGNSSFYNLTELPAIAREAAANPEYNASIRLQLNGLAYTLEQLLDRLGWRDLPTAIATPESEATWTRPAPQALAQDGLSYYCKLSGSLIKELIKGLPFTQGKGKRRYYANADIKSAIEHKLSSPFIRQETRNKLSETLNWLNGWSGAPIDFSSSIDLLGGLPTASRMEILHSQRETLRDEGEKMLAETEKLLQEAHNILNENEDKSGLTH